METSTLLKLAAVILVLGGIGYLGKIFFLDKPEPAPAASKAAAPPNPFATVLAPSPGQDARFNSMRREAERIQQKANDRRAEVDRMVREMEGPTPAPTQPPAEPAPVVASDPDGLIAQIRHYITDGKLPEAEALIDDLANMSLNADQAQTLNDLRQQVLDQKSANRH